MFVWAALLRPPSPALRNSHEEGPAFLVLTAVLARCCLLVPPSPSQLRSTTRVMPALRCTWTSRRASSPRGAAALANSSRLRPRGGNAVPAVEGATPAQVVSSKATPAAAGRSFMVSAKTRSVTARSRAVSRMGTYDSTVRGTPTGAPEPGRPCWCTGPLRGVLVAVSNGHAPRGHGAHAPRARGPWPCRSEPAPCRVPLPS